ncbi:MAG: peptidoglycan-binding domain-containing protein [Pseudomonadota bacterium]
MKRTKTVSAALIAAMLATSGPAQASDAGKIAVGAIAALGLYSILKNKNNGQAQAAPAPRQQPAPPRNTYNPAREQNRQMQSALNGVGFNAGGADGIVGPRTRSAISDYQAHMGYPVTGSLNDFQREQLLGAHQQIQNGNAAARFPEINRAEGPRGLVKALQDPSYASRFGQQPQPQLANTPASSGDDDLVLPSSLARSNPVQGGTSSMAEHCELTTGIMQANAGPAVVDNIADPDQALSEQFCEARSYAITQGNGLLDQLDGKTAEFTDFCTKIAARLAPAVAEIPSGDTKAVAVKAQEIMEPVFQGDLTAAATAGQICLGIGYRQDDSDIALGAATMMLASGKMSYNELFGHHTRWGFGTAVAKDTSRQWYLSAINAMDQGAEPAFLPSQSAQRNAIIRQALAMPDTQVGDLRVPELNLRAN